MRAKTVRDRRTGAQTLTIHTTRGESLDLGQAQWLAEGHWYMLPFRFESNGAEILFYYDVTHCETMHGVLRSVVPGGQYVGMLVAVLSVMEQCEGHRLPLSYVQWDPKSVYMSAQGYPLFAVVPALGLEPDRDTVSTLLQTLADARRTRLEDAVVQGYQRALAEFLGRNSEVNADALHDFMSYLLPGTVQPRQAQSAQSPHEDNGSETQFGATVVSDGTMVGATRFGATVLSSKPKLQTTPQQPVMPTTSAAPAAPAMPAAHAAPAQPTPVTSSSPVTQPTPAMPIAVNLPRKQETQPARENPVREQYIREDFARGVAPMWRLLRPRVTPLLPQRSRTARQLPPWPRLTPVTPQPPITQPTPSTTLPPLAFPPLTTSFALSSLSAPSAQHCVPTRTTAKARRCCASTRTSPEALPSHDCATVKQ